MCGLSGRYFIIEGDCKQQFDIIGSRNCAANARTLGSAWASSSLKWSSRASAASYTSDFSSLNSRALLNTSLNSARVRVAQKIPIIRLVLQHFRASQMHMCQQMRGANAL
jgi:hypothetical protein